MISSLSTISYSSIYYNFILFKHYTLCITFFKFLAHCTLVLLKKEAFFSLEKLRTYIRFKALVKFSLLFCFNIPFLTLFTFVINFFFFIKKYQYCNIQSLSFALFSSYIGKINSFNLLAFYCNTHLQIENALQFREILVSYK